MPKARQFNLNVLAYVNSFTLWHYKHEGTYAEVIQPNFFLTLHNYLNQGDLIIINCDDGNTSVWVREVSETNINVRENLLPVLYN